MTAEQLEELLGKVTQGEWDVQGDTLQDTEEFYIYADKVVDGYTPIIAEGLGAGDYMKGSGEAYYNATLIALAPSLARRVLAAEKLVEALGTVRDYVSDAKDGALFYDNGDSVSYTMASEDLDRIDASLTSYREASK